MVEYKEITNSEFMQAVAQTKRRPIDSNPLLYRRVVVKGERIVEFKNLAIAGNVIIEEDKVDNCSLSINNCKFLGNLKFVNVRLRSLSIDAEIGGLLLISGGAYSSIIFSAGVYRESIKLNGCKLRGLLQFNEVTIKGKLELACDEILKELNFKSGEYENIVLSSGVFKGSVEIFSINVKGGFTIAGGIYENNVVFYGGKYTGIVSVNAGKFSNGIVFQDGIFYSAVCSNGGDYEKQLQIQGGEYYDKFEVAGGQYRKGVKFSGGSISEGVKACGGAWGGDLVINNNNTLIVSLVELDSLQRGMAIQIEDIKLFEIRLISLSSLSMLRLVNMEFKRGGGQLRIENSSLNNTELIGCDFSDGRLSVDNSNLMGIFYTDTLFPERFASAEKDTKKNIEQVRDTYSQLKTVAEKQNDRQSSLYYQSKTNDQIFKLVKIRLRKEGGGRLNYFIPLRKNWGEFAQLLLNKCSNDFGQSYLRAFVMLFICTIVLYSMYIPSVVPELNWTWNPLDVPKGLAGGFRLYGDKFFYFINPIRKTGFLCGDASCSCAHWLAAPVDWFSRIIIFYLTYQFVQAFRKYGRR